MKLKNYFSVLILIAMAMGFCSCDDEDEYPEVVLTLNATSISYNDDGVWSDYLTPNTTVESQGFTFSHSATPEWGSWNGFVASRATSMPSADDQDWLAYQYTAMTAGGVSGAGTPSMIAHWSEYDENNTGIHTCRIDYGTGVAGTQFTPVSVYVNNNVYSYYSLINGTAWSKKFESGDYFILHIYGSKNEQPVGPVDVYLADFTEGNSYVMKEWTQVNLESLGAVDYLYCTMSSSDSGQWGINNPTYFALDRLVIRQ